MKRAIVTVTHQELKRVLEIPDSVTITDIHQTINDNRGGTFSIVVLDEILKNVPESGYPEHISLFDLQKNFASGE